MRALYFVSLSLSLSFVLIACGDNNTLGPDAFLPQCGDGIDNDGDGTTDFPDDLGCENDADETEDSPAAPGCDDNRDNDGDGKIDFPDDPGCLLPQGDSELDDCPDGPGCPQCADGQDNDGNGMTDFPNDPGCTSAGDQVEFFDNPTACGANLMIKMLPVTGDDTGMLTSASISTLTTPCGGGGGAPAIAYVFHLDEPKVIVASTDNATTTVDTVLDLRSAMCAAPSAHIACHDDVNANNSKSTLTQSLGAGTYYLIVEGHSTSDVGPYMLTVDLFAGEGVTCTAQNECGPGLVCRTPVGQTMMVCSKPVCTDGLDDDADGNIDFPNDPGCAAPTDDTEDDVCATMPTDPACPACANTTDDDSDGDTDFPDDPSCLSASGTSESCPQSEPLLIATTGATMGTTIGATNDFTPPPGSFNGHACTSTGTVQTAPDRAIQIDLPAMDTLGLNLTLGSPFWNSSHTLLDSTCGGTPIDCRDATAMPLTNVPAGRYYLIVDGNNIGSNVVSGSFTLNISGRISNNQSCESPLAQSGALTCNTGFVCKGPAGMRTCAPTQCNDGIDNNGDGVFDHPADPGCDSEVDDSEDTVCPGASCPVCADGIDNDLDGQTDYPDDVGCQAASGNNEGCPDSDAVVAITGPLTTGTTVGATDDHNPSCVTSNGADVVYTLEIPPLQSLTLDTEDSVVDTVLSLMNSACAEPALACDDDGGVGIGDSQIVRSFVPGGRYTIAVDADSATNGTFNLNVQGVVLPGASCESPLFQAGALTCPVGFACTGTPGMRRCNVAQCVDGIDNNGDGATDYPEDPGCESIADNTETTVCPGPECPECSDTIDNDGDGATDYPLDSGCIAASTTTEGCTQSEPIGNITTRITTGTTAGAANDFTPTCGSTTSHSAADVALQLQLPGMATLSLNLTGFDSATSLLDSTCGGNAIACSDPANMALTNIAAGTYYFVVDGYSSGNGPWTLTTTGTVAPGQSCEGSLFADGAFTCTAGHACNGPAGSRTCTPTQCNDGVDNNGNGVMDFPADPGCANLNDNLEDTVCPGTSCPVCSDMIDNDMDGMTDYPTDTACLAASGTSEACAQTEAVGVITQKVTTGTTAGQTNDYTPTCGSSTTHTAPDLALELDLPQMTALTLNLTGFDSAHSLLNSTCGGAPIACSDPANMALTNIAAGKYYVIVDGWSSGNGPWTLTTTGTIAVGGSCEGPLFASGAFVCPSGHACAGPAGMRTCTLALCNDGMDNDSDGDMDFPADPGCNSISDHDETDDCSPTPGPNCPVCSNTLDDDTDTFIDYPMDTRCPSASFFSENICPIDPDLNGEIVAVTSTGTLAAPAADNYEQSCQTSTGNDRIYGLQLPVPVATLVIDTIGSTVSDTVVSLWNEACSTELGCDDDGDPASNRSLLTVSNVAAGNYTIKVDSFGSSNNGAFTLNVRGTVTAGTACTHPHFTSGVLSCPSGTSCTGGMCQ